MMSPEASNGVHTGTMRPARAWRIARFRLGLMAMVAALGMSVLAHNLDTRATSIHYANDFIASMAQRAAGNGSLVRVGDEFWVVIKTTPGPGTTTGVGGYQTFYVPPWAQVLDAAYVLPDPASSTGFSVIPMKGQSPIAIGAGPIGAKSTPDLAGLTLPGTNVLGLSHAPMTAAGLHRGTIAGVYADTGIFYSTDPRTGFNTYGAALTGGTPPLINNSGDTVGEWDAANVTDPTVLGVMTLWDSYQLRAYGHKAGPIIDSPDQRGNAPWGLANVVAGPQSGYAWEFDYATYLGASGTALQRVQAAIKVGPWNRIRYPGGQISLDQPGLISTVLGYTAIDASTVGFALSPSNPLPPNTKAVRFAIGQLELGRPEFSAIKVRVTNLPRETCALMYGDAFGGDAGGTDSGKDHIWRYFDPTVVSLSPCAFLQKTVSKALVAPGETFFYTIVFANNGTVALPNVTLTDTLPAGLTFVSARPAPTSSAPPSYTWNLGSVQPNSMTVITNWVKAVSLGTHFNNVIARSGTTIIGSVNQAVEVANRSLLQKEKSVTPSVVAAGQTVDYTITVRNDGTGGNGTPLIVRDVLPAGFSYASLLSATLNGAAISSPTIQVSTSDSANPTFTISQSIQPGKNLVIRFQARVGAGVGTGTYFNGVELLYEGKRQPPIPEAPVTVGGGKIGDTLFRDWNGNGAMDSGEEGMPGVAVTLLLDADSNGSYETTVGSQVTDASGRYLFLDIVPGNYRVSVPAPGSGGVPANYTLTADPDGGAATGTYDKTLAPNETYLAADFGYRPTGTGSIGDTIFADDDKDGAFDGGETGIADVTVYLYEDTNGNGIRDAGDVLVATTVTGSGGNYLFAGLATGLSYLVHVDPNDSALSDHFNPYGYQVTTPNAYPVPNLSGSFLGADIGWFGLEPGSIGDTVFVDNDGDGLYDPDVDAPLSGVTVNLFRDGILVATAVSAPDGTYLVDNLAPGPHTVVVSAGGGIPDGYAPAISQHTVNLSAGEVFLAADFPFAQLLAKSVDRPFAVPDDTLAYTINVRSLAGGVLDNLTVSDRVPAGTTLLSVGQGGQVGNPREGSAGVAGSWQRSSSSGTLVVNPVADADFWTENPNVNYGLAAGMWIYAGNIGCRSALRFDVSSVPWNAVVDSAVMRLTAFERQNVPAGGLNVSAHRILNSWGEQSVSWNWRLLLALWGTAGGDFAPTASATTLAPNANGPYDWTITALVRDWVAGTVPNNGVLMKMTDESGATERYFGFWTKEHLIASERPRLTVGYTVPAMATTTAIEVVPGWVFDTGAGGNVTVSMTVTATGAVADINPSALTVVPGAHGATATLVSGPTGNPASFGSSGGSATFTWVYNVAAGSAPDEVAFSGSATASGTTFAAATSNGVAVDPADPANTVVTWNLGSTTAAGDGATTISGSSATPSTIAYVASANASGSATTLNPAKPTGTVQNDVLIAGLSWDGGNDRTITAPVGWTQIGSATSVSGGTSSIAQRGSTTSVYDADANGTVSVAKPTGVVAGDVMIANFSIRGGNTFPTANGWTTIATESIEPGTDRQYHRVALLYRVADGTEGSSITFNFATTYPANVTAAIVAFSGVTSTGGFLVGGGAGGPFDVAPGSWNYKADSPANASSITTASGNALVAMFVGGFDDRGTVSAFSTATSPGALNDGSYSFNNLQGTIGAGWKVKPTAGATGLGTATLSVNGKNAAILIALKTGTAKHGQAAYYKVAGASEPSSYGWGISAAGKWTVGLSAYRGVDTANPVNAQAAQGNASSVNAVAPTITTTVNNAMLVGVFASKNGTPVASPPSGMAERIDASTAVGGTTEVGLEMSDETFATAGATGTRTATLSASTINIGRLIALKPGSTSTPWSYSVNTALSANRSLVTSNDAIGVVLTATATTLTGSPPFPITVTAGALSVSGTSGATATFGAASPLSQAVNSGVPATFAYNSTAITAGATPGILTLRATPSDPNGTWAQSTANTVIVTPPLTFTATVNNPPGVNVVTNQAALNTNGTLVALSPPVYTVLGGSIGDRVWRDSDGDGVQDPSETGLAGVEVQVFNSNGVPVGSAVTDAFGTYRVPGLSAGDYVVRINPTTYPAGYEPTTPGTLSVTLTTGQQYDDDDFGFRPVTVGAGGIGDRLWLDADSDGVQDAGEAGLEGITVVLDRLIDGVWTTVASQNTGTNGLYAFAALVDGQYRVGVATNSPVVSPYGSTNALGGATVPTHDLDGTNTPHVALVTLSESQRVDDTLDFGYNWSGSIGDTVWWDADADGVQDAGEAPASNAFVLVYFDVNGNGILDPNFGDYQIALARTDAEGQYLVANLPPGPFLVDVYEDSLTAGGIRDIVPTTLEVIYHALSAGEAFLGADFGYFVGARVEGNVFWDDNRNAYLEGVEQRLTNVTVTLAGTDRFGTPVTRVATTDADGHFAFLVPEGDYTVAYSHATLLAGYPSLGDATTPASYAFHAFPGEDGNRISYDFGVDSSGRIGDTVFADVNGTPGQQAGEAGLADVTVKLYRNPDNSAALNGDETLLEVTVTDAPGKYEFVGLTDGAYLIQVDATTLPTGYATTPTTDPTGALDGQGTAAVSGGGAVLTLDFGYPAQTLTYGVSGTIYDDNGSGGGTAGNGTRDGAEPGLANVTVTILVDADGAGPNSPVTYTVQTDAAGNYTLSGVPSGAVVTVAVDATTLPNAAYVQTGDPDATRDNSTTFTMPAGNVTGKNFGYLAQYGSIVGTVVAGDGNGLADFGEPALANVTVTLLYAGADGIFGTDDDTTTNTVTDANGAYTFNDLVPGNYRIMETDPAGYASLADADGGNPNSIDVLGLAPGQDVAARDFEDTESNRHLGDRVWHDVDGDGAQQPDEPGLINVTVRLYAVGADGLPGTADDELVGTTVTDPVGSYLFVDLAPGSFTVEVDEGTLPPGFAAQPTYDLDGTNTAHLAVAVIDAEPGRLDTDFGYRSDGRFFISGTVKDDFDADGDFDDPDQPVGGVTVLLYSDPDGDGDPADGELQATEVTGSDGVYTFDGLPSGRYVVVEVDPVYSVSTADAASPNNNRIPVALSNADSLGNDFLDAVEPGGYFYDVADGRIVPGGAIQVQGDGAVVLMDGSSGQFRFVSTNPVETVFTLVVTPPPGYILDPSRPAQPGTFDPTGLGAPVVLGSSATTNAPPFCLQDYSASSNVFYYTFRLVPGDPAVINNNFPLLDPMLEIAGTVFNDLDGLTDGFVDGSGTDAGGLYANLVDPATHMVLASIKLATNGTYCFAEADGVTSNTAYQVILTSTNQTVGAALTLATLPAEWKSTGEHVGAGPGSDGTVDARLLASTTLDGVREVNFGLRKVPDITPVITAVPNVMHGIQKYYITVRITELNLADTAGLITVRIPKDTRWTLDGPYDPNLTELGPAPLNNDDWAYSQDVTHHIFTTTATIPAGGFSYFGFHAIWNAGQTRGHYTVTSQIDSWSGGEDRIGNNVDADILDYFIN